ncbi:MAG: hypothetical protein JNK89_02330 [Saprospiraceae bacterium]|nr:hypothetical protein [Saprospiraceae bacterium]
MKRHHAYRFSLTACAAAFHTLVCRLLVGLAVLGCPPPVSGQEPPCKTWVDCSNLRVEVVLQDPYNLSPDCAGAASTSACGGGSNFTHLFYTVRLKYTPTSLNEDLDFYLRYEELYVAVRLAVSGASPVLFSQIDTKVTKSCYDNGPGANWGANGINGAIFTPQTSAVDIHFQNFQAGETCTDADLIHFMPADCTPNDPNEDFDCAYADLFIVAVRAYPGESIQVVCQGGPTFDPGPGVGPCNIGCNYVPNQAVQAALPAAPSGSPNSDLRVQLANPVQAPDGSCTIDIELANSGTSAVVLY